MPDDPAALVTIGALRARATVLQAGNGLVDGAKLLVTRDHLARLTVSLLKDGEVAHKVKKVCWPQPARGQHLLALQSGMCAAHRNGPLLRLAEEERRTGALGLFRSQRRHFLLRLN